MNQGHTGTFYYTVLYSKPFILFEWREWGKLIGCFRLLLTCLIKQGVFSCEAMSVCKTKHIYFSFIFSTCILGAIFFLHSIIQPTLTHTFQQDCMHFMPVRTADYNVKCCARCHIVLYMYMYCSAWTGAAGLFCFAFEFTMYVLDWIFMWNLCTLIKIVELMFALVWFFQTTHGGGDLYQNWSRPYLEQLHMATNQIPASPCLAKPWKWKLEADWLPLTTDPNFVCYNSDKFLSITSEAKSAKNVSSAIMSLPAHNL